MELLFVPYHFLQGAVTKITGAVIVICSAAFYIHGTMSAVYAIGMTIAKHLCFIQAWSVQETIPHFYMW